MREIGTSWDRENRNIMNDNFRESKNRVDNLIKNTPQPSEVVDIRVDEEGTIHTTAKERIDSEASKRKEKDDELTAQLAQIVTNVKSFGAKGDGITDDTQAFLDARAISKHIYVPEGEYVVEDLNLDSARITGKGIIKWQSNATSPMLKLTGKTVIKGVTLDGNKENQTSNITAITLDQGRGSKFKDIEIKNFRHKVLISGIADTNYVDFGNVEVTNCGDTTGSDIFAVRSSDWVFDNVRFDGIGDGHCIRLGLFNGDTTLTPVRNTIVTNSSFKNTQHNGVTCEIYTEDVKITNSFFDNLPQAIKCEGEGNTVKHIIIDTNIFRNITLATALNLSVPDVTFINNICSDMQGGPYFGNNYNCSTNKFYRVGKSDGHTIGDVGGTARGIINDNLIIDSPYNAIFATQADIKGNNIRNPGNYAIRVSGSDMAITTNNIKGGNIGIVLVSTTSRTVVDKNIVNDTVTPISYTYNEAFATNIIGENIGFEINVAVTTPVANNSITVSTRDVAKRIDTENGATTSVLSTINGGKPHQMITLYGVTASRTITVDSSGNIRPKSSFTITGSTTNITLLYTGSVWVEISRS